MASRYPPAWLLGTTGLSVAKILENMELGHNIMHGQWDWMNDPKIHSSTWDWDTVSPASAWKHSHNYVHHTHTNIVGLDKDVGYEIMRVDPKQPWHPVYLLQPFYNVLLMLFFEWGVAVHDLDFEAIRKGTKPKKQLRDELKSIGTKIARQAIKDYVVFPALSGRKGFKRTLLANVTANLVRNVWSNAIIFCGHFPDQAYTYTEEEASDESRGAWYIRQLLGAVEHRRRRHLPPDERQPQLPGRAPPLPGPAELALQGDRAEGEGDLREVRPALQHGPVLAAVADGPADADQARLPGRRDAAEGAALRGAAGADRRGRPAGPGRAGPDPGVSVATSESRLGRRLAGV